MINWHLLGKKWVSWNSPNSGTIIEYDRKNSIFYLFIFIREHLYSLYFFNQYLMLSWLLNLHILMLLSYIKKLGYTYTFLLKDRHIIQYISFKLIWLILPKLVIIGNHDTQQRKNGLNWSYNTWSLVYEKECNLYNFLTSQYFL